jgi:tetratricopeptide (TPR) repeat protein
MWDSDPSLSGVPGARKLYEEALRLDPGLAEALKGRTLDRQLTDDPAVDRDRAVKELDNVSRRAIKADRHDPNSWQLRDLALEAQWQWEGALEANTEALRIDPYRNITLKDRGRLLLLTGRSEQALPLIEQAIGLDPGSPDVASYLRVKCDAYLLLGRFDEAIATCEKSLALQDSWLPHLGLVAAYAIGSHRCRSRMSRRCASRTTPSFCGNWRTTYTRDCARPVFPKTNGQPNVRSGCQAFKRLTPSSARNARR